MKSLPGLGALVPEVDDLLVDLWGVIHDGERPCEGALDALERIAALPGKRVLFLTNTSRASACGPLERGVPLVCTNPDRVIPRPRGPEGIGPGEIAHGYASMGGRVVLYGKPHAPIYAAARRRLGGGERRLLAVGDLIETDIRGARAAGIPSVLVTRGRDGWQTADIVPDHVVERFTW